MLLFRVVGGFREQVSPEYMAKRSHLGEGACVAVYFVGLDGTCRNTADSQVFQVRDTAIKEMLRFYADRGDVQTCVTVIVVLGPYGETLFPSRQRKQWLTGYIGMA